MFDRTLVPLSDKPGHHGKAYFDRKSNYSLNVQLINLPNLRIVDYVIGPVGSMHNASAFAESRVSQNRAELLAPGEWIWADSAYMLVPWCITPYKKPATLEPENRRFNYYVSAVLRICSEHAVSFLKCRFQLLRGLCQQIKNRRDHLWAVKWIHTCIIIHTLVQDIKQEDTGSGSMR
ncbi:DDE Tnp4 domain-containing protein [Mycena indigotica]|uniref:DDE Tnp4 domain-containing protein n=1 Tax=Mycena indigotica TaxID=2126181 RepID=A0A8H6T8A9_9AGAR|nr:DDE Tnp4 domain-containing protein [Mycena indigotica]KAF7312741.1 DDE Tnp4 domain-containing protein [Mycena indigotica]